MRRLLDLDHRSHIDQIARALAALGKRLEVRVLEPAWVQLAKLTDTSASSIQAVYACIKLLNKVMLTEGGGVRLSKAA